MKNDGGPAFPSHGQIIDREMGNPFIMMGMSLRDYFAAAALNGVIALTLKRAELADAGKDVKQWASWSYSIADAMLAERSKDGA